MITEITSSIKYCVVCSELFERPSKYSRSQWEDRKSCSVDCGRTLNGLLRRGRPLSPEWRAKISVGNLGKARPKTNEHKKKLSMAFTPEQRALIAEGKRGDRNPNWKGGITPVNILVRMSAEYRLWRESVFIRDDYTCVWCGERGWKLNADHIKPFAYYPELRFAIDNGRTLCVPCHKSTDTFGARKPKHDD